MPHRLHPRIDADALAALYRERGRVSVEPFLADEAAARLRDHLLARDDWRVRLKGESERVYDFDCREFASWDAARTEAVRKLVAPLTPDSFTFSFDRIVVSDEKRSFREEGTELAEFAAFLSSREVVELVAKIAGDPAIGYADAFASRYGPGDFLTIHRDKGESNRAVAYVFDLTRDWRPEWGGLLLFHDEKGDVRAGLSPRFNVLNLFAVPQSHSVSPVAAFAPLPRLSVTGWFRAG